MPAGLEVDSVSTSLAILHGRFPALRSRDFRLLWSGQVISMVGSQMQNVAIHWHIYSLTHSTLALGAIGLARIGPILLFSLFLNWFSTSCDTNGMPKGCNTHSELHGMKGSFSAFETYGILDILLVGACVAPFILAYIIARGHDLTWRPGEVTMIVGITAFALILVNGVILGRPGGDDPHNVEISIEIGYLIGLLGSACIAFGGFVRQAEQIRGRKPPGVM